MFFKTEKTKREQVQELRRRRRNDEPTSFTGVFIGRKPLITLVAFFAMTFVLVPICFWGESPVNMTINPNQVARMRIVSDFEFSYPSRVRTDLAKKQAGNEMPAQYRRNDKVYDEYAQQMRGFIDAFETRLLPELTGLSQPETETALEAFTSMMRAKSGLAIDAGDLATILENVPAGDRRGLFLQGLVGLRGILRDGVYAQPTGLNENRGRPTGYSHSLTEAEASNRLKMYLDNLGVNAQTANALYRIYFRGLQPNLDYDPVATDALKRRAIDSVHEQVVRIREGQVLVEPGNTVTPEQVESVNAYRLEAYNRENFAWGVVNLLLVQRTFLTALLMVSAFIYLHLAFTRKGRSTRRMTLLGTVLVGSMILLRIASEVGAGELAVRHPLLLNVVPWAAPVAVAGMITAILVGGSPAVLMSVVISVLNGMMQGNSIEAFITSLLGGLAAIALVTGARQRGRVVRAGILSGMAVAACAVLLGVVNELPALVISLQVLVALIVGLLTGVFVIGVLPVLEYLFKYTSDITLLELTDFNQPLLRKLQMVAPGTYHHSLMVANLAERAASQIGASALLCRATCLYHDIGKMSKPEYFVENQTDGFNPHDDRNPTMSALIIKNHVKEGVQMARDYKLPQVVIDVIREHHGNSLIKFFYSKAIKQAQQAELTLGDGDGDVQVDEAAFRYEGPRPQTKESAVILCADAVEAASRSLRKVTPQSIEELVDAIIRSRIDEGQLDEAPVTIEEIHKIRNSFCFSLINMLHSRIEYPKMEDTKKKRPAAAAPATAAPTAPVSPAAAGDVAAVSTGAASAASATATATVPASAPATATVQAASASSAPAAQAAASTAALTAAPATATEANSAAATDSANMPQVSSAGAVSANISAPAGVPTVDIVKTPQTGRGLAAGAVSLPEPAAAATGSDASAAQPVAKGNDSSSNAAADKTPAAAKAPVANAAAAAVPAAGSTPASPVAQPIADKPAVAKPAGVPISTHPDAAPGAASAGKGSNEKKTPPLGN